MSAKNMDFFAHQDRAKSRSGLIYTLFFTAITLLGLINAGIVWYALHAAEYTDGDILSISLLTALLTYLVILGGSGIEWLQFSGGGKRVAEMLGGHLISPGTLDPNERRLLNIVEEMAIASGTPIPPVYLLEEDGINAFAAGKKPEDAVIGVTRGALNTFNREEMQGVIAHEFSHILNGDVRKNLRLGAMVFGVFCLYILGQVLIRSVFFAPRSRNNKEGGGIIIAIIALGVALCVLGILGQLVGRILQMAHSRQREFLADASAVQFTRNPEGIGNALIKLSHGETRLRSSRSNSLNHLFFGEATLTGLLSSHPPLKERIQRVLPHYSPQRAA